MINPHTKFDVSMFSHYEDMKGYAKCRNWGGSGVRSHRRSSAMTPFDGVHRTSHLTLIETMCLFCTVFGLQRKDDNDWVKNGV